MDTIELSRLAECESVIERGLKTFTDVGNALLEIRDSKLYRANFDTFDDYCRDRWGFSRIHAFRMIEAAQVTDNLLPMGNIIPSTERQARPLTQLEPEAQRVVWQQVTEMPGLPTAAKVQTKVDEYKYNTEQAANARAAGFDVLMPERPHVANNSGENEWYTPPEFTEAARRVMGEIDLDPASSVIANRTVGASLYYSKDDNGLTRRWAGRVWMNPPYAAELIGKFCEKLVGHYVDGDITEAIVLVNNATETGWFNQLVGVSDAIVFPKGRIKYLDSTGYPANSPLQGQAFIYMGNSPECFIDEFSKFGWGVKIWKR